jgi:hydroxyacylglutathione hydrolase
MTEAQINMGPVSLIPGQKGSKFPYCNSLYIEAAGLIIDPSSNRQLLETLHREQKIHTVCLTHWHEDHIRFLHLLGDCKFWMSETDSIPLSNHQDFIKWYGFEGPGFKELRRTLEARMVSEIHFKPRIPDKLLSDGDIIDLGSVTMEVIATPGHSPGHLSFFFPEPSILFLGDYSLDPFGPWTGDPFSDIDQCIASINRLRQVPADILIAGHRPQPITSGADKRWERYLRTITVREEEILAFLSDPRTLDEIIDQWIILKIPKKPIAYFRLGEKAHIEKHLARLIRQGAVRFEEEHYHMVR